MAAEKGGVPEAEVIQNGQFRRVDRYGHFRSEWTIARETSYIQSTKLLDFLILWKLWEKNQFLCMKNVQ